MITNDNIYSLKRQLGFIEEIDCSFEENQQYRQLLRESKPLPEGVFLREGTAGSEYESFYTIANTTLSKEEQQEYLLYTQTLNLITIKKCMIFFAVLTVISIIFGFVYGLVLSLLS